MLRKVAGNLNIQNADDREAVKLNKAVFLGDDFKQLWERIKYRTTFRVDFDPEQLIETCADEIRDNLKVGKARFVTRTARIDIDRGRCGSRGDCGVGRRARRARLRITRRRELPAERDQPHPAVASSRS